MKWYQYPKAAVFALSILGVSGVLLGKFVFVPLGIAPIEAGALGAAVVFFALNITLGKVYANTMNGQKVPE